LYFSLGYPVIIVVINFLILIIHHENDAYSLSLLIACLFGNICVIFEKSFHLGSFFVLKILAINF